LSETLAALTPVYKTMLIQSVEKFFSEDWNKSRIKYLFFLILFMFIQLYSETLAPE
jgi:hypothetical protein